jgi:hypothetical protein
LPPHNRTGQQHEKLVFVPSDDVDPGHGVQRPGNAGAAAVAG